MGLGDANRRRGQGNMNWSLAMREIFKSFLKDESGAAAAEYALILAIVGAGIAAAALGLGQAIVGAINAAAGNIAGG